jgi:hypothetical protein
MQLAAHASGAGRCRLSAACSVGEWAARLARDRDEDVKHEWFVKDAWVYDSGLIVNL